MGFNYKKVYLE